MNVKAAGRVTTHWQTESVCTGAWNGNDGCGASLEVAEGDLFLRTYLGDYDPEKRPWGEKEQTHPTYRCPICGKDTAITDVPRDVRERLAAKG